jgi:FO synthase subunit 2
MHLPHLESSLDRLLKSVSRATAQTLDRALSGQDITVDEATGLFEADGADLLAMMAAADHLRAQTVGDVVTYVTNRNINFTNVCVKQCGFCAFSRGHLAEEGYFLPMEEIIRRAGEARDLGASEVCVQAGLAPGMDGWHYVKLCRALKTAFPDLHVHGFSPEEVLYGSTLTGATIRDYLIALKDAASAACREPPPKSLSTKCASAFRRGASASINGSMSFKLPTRWEYRPRRRSCTAT